MDFSTAVRPTASGVSQASTAAVAAFFTPSRCKLLRITARSIGAGGEDWKTLSESSPSETTAGAWVGSGLDSAEKARSAHGEAWVPVPEMTSGGLKKLRATAVKAMRSPSVVGVYFQTAVPAAAAKSSTQNRRWNEPFTGSMSGSPGGPARVEPPAECQP